jgi:hypothetical protein
VGAVSAVPFNFFLLANQRNLAVASFAQSIEESKMSDENKDPKVDQKNAEETTQLSEEALSNVTGGTTTPMPVSNILKTTHDTAKPPIANIK